MEEGSLPQSPPVTGKGGSPMGLLGRSYWKATIRLAQGDAQNPPALAGRNRLKYRICSSCQQNTLKDGFALFYARPGTTL